MILTYEFAASIETWMNVQLGEYGVCVLLWIVESSTGTFWSPRGPLVPIPEGR